MLPAGKAPMDTDKITEAQIDRAVNRLEGEKKAIGPCHERASLGGARNSAERVTAIPFRV